MKSLKINKALVWKELIQNKWIYLIAILVGMVTVIETILKISGLSEQLKSQDPILWSVKITHMFEYGLNFKNTTWLYIAILLGINALSIERSSNTIEFLVSQPVSRKEIITAKYISNALVIASIMLLNMMIFIIIGKIFPAEYSTVMVVQWFIITNFILITVFSISFFATTITGNKVSSLVMAFALIFVPSFLKEITQVIVKLFYGIEMFYYMGETKLDILILNIQQGIFLPNYANIMDYRNLIGYIIKILIFILITFIFYILSVECFEKNNLESNGKILMFGDSRKILQWFITFIIAIFTGNMVCGIYGDTKQWIIGIATIVIYGVLVLICEIVFRIRTKIGYK